MARRSPEEKAARRREEWNRRITAGEKQEAAAVRKQAGYVADIKARAESLSERGKPMQFRTIGIAVMDGSVYVMKPGLPPKPVRLGPLPGARATVKRLKTKVESRFVLSLLIPVSPQRNLGRVEVTISTSEGTHHALVESAAGVDSKRDKKAEEEVRQFNALAGVHS